MIAVCILALLFALSAGWVWGHSSARIVYRPIGARHHQDEIALTDHEAQQFKHIEQHFDGIQWRPDA